jgi:hypothetical protein
MPIGGIPGGGIIGIIPGSIPGGGGRFPSGSMGMGGAKSPGGAIPPPPRPKAIGGIIGIGGGAIRIGGAIIIGGIGMGTAELPRPKPGTAVTGKVKAKVSQ